MGKTAGGDPASSPAARRRASTYALFSVIDAASTNLGVTILPFRIYWFGRCLPLVRDPLAYSGLPQDQAARGKGAENWVAFEPEKSVVITFE